MDGNEVSTRQGRMPEKAQKHDKADHKDVTIGEERSTRYQLQLMKAEPFRTNTS